MRKLEYRKPRTPSNIRIEFAIDGETIPGTCLNFSDAGICAELPRTLASGTVGMLTLYHPTYTLKVEARIVHAEDALAGLVFIFDSPRQRGNTIRFMASIATRPA